MALRLSTTKPFGGTLFHEFLEPPQTVFLLGVVEKNLEEKDVVKTLRLLSFEMDGFIKSTTVSALAETTTINVKEWLSRALVLLM